MVTKIPGQGDSLALSGREEGEGGQEGLVGCLVVWCAAKRSVRASPALCNSLASMDLAESGADA